MPDAPDPWLLNDPWRAARPVQRLEPGEGKVVPDQVEQRLQQQASKLQALEHDMKSFREECHAARKEDRAAFMHDVEGLRQQVGHVATDVTEQIRTSVLTLQEAQARQQAQMQSSLEELKNLFQSQPGLPRKARKEEEPGLCDGDKRGKGPCMGRGGVSSSWGAGFCCRLMSGHGWSESLASQSFAVLSICAVMHTQC